GYTMALRQLLYDVKASQPSTDVQRPQAACLHPQDSHAAARCCWKFMIEAMSSPSMKMRCQISRFISSQRRVPCGAAPDRCSSANARTNSELKSALRDARAPVTNSSTRGENRLCSQRPTGTGK